MAKTAKIALLSLATLPVAVGYFFLAVYGSTGDLMEVYTSIGALAGLVFTVAGLWAGFVFPEAIKTLFMTVSTAEREAKAEEYKNILQPVLMALACLLGAVTVPILRKILHVIYVTFDVSAGIVFFKVVAALLALVLTLMLGWAIAKVLQPSIYYYRRVWYRAQNEKKADARMPKADHPPVVPPKT